MAPSDETPPPQDAVEMQPPAPPAASEEPAAKSAAPEPIAVEHSAETQGPASPGLAVHSGLALQFADVSFSVTKKKKTTHILKGISGAAVRGPERMATGDHRG